MNSKDATRPKTLTYNAKTLVRAPASTSNLGPGFDVFGLALDVMHDTVEVKRLQENSVLVEFEGVEAESIPTNPEKNSAGRTALEFMKRYPGSGFQIWVKKGIPPGSGLGSSGATAAATAVAIDNLLGLNLTKTLLTEIAAEGEVAAAGAPHADNVAPSIFGGFVIIHSYNPLEVLAVPIPTRFEFALAVPKGLKKTTKYARSVLPTEVAMPKIIKNLGAASVLVAGLMLSDQSLVGRGMLGDQIVEPVRAKLYPGYSGAKKAALGKGALGATLSGAGPTVIALVDRGRADPAEVAKVMREAFEAEGIGCDDYVSRPTTGARLIPSEL